MKRIFPALAVVLIFILLCGGVFAADAASEHCFSTEEFLKNEACPDGIILTSVPAADKAGVYLGSRRLCAGDVLTGEQLQQIRMVGESGKTESAVFSYCTICDGHVDFPQAMTVSLFPKPDLAPEAKDSEFETYKNIAKQGDLNAKDPENGTLKYTLVKPPKKGTAELSEDGTFVYTPIKNKVGKDSFVYTATDEGGNTSREATVSVNIMKPSSKAAYSDMQEDLDNFYAVWLADQDLFSGEQIIGQNCFGPEKSLTRGEFLAMAMKLKGTEPVSSAVSAGFEDEQDAPGWMRPYITTALKGGIITGADSGSGLVFRPKDSATKAECAVMLQNILQLPTPKEKSVFASASVPAWAENSLSALACAGLNVDAEKSSQPITRREAAKLLYEAARLLESSKAAELMR